MLALARKLAEVIQSWTNFRYCTGTTPFPSLHLVNKEFIGYKLFFRATGDNIEKEEREILAVVSFILSTVVTTKK